MPLLLNRSTFSRSLTRLRVLRLDARVEAALLPVLEAVALRDEVSVYTAPALLAPTSSADLSLVY